MMATPVEFIATGDMKTGVIAESVSLGVIEITTTKIAEWKAKTRAANHGEETWAIPGSHKKFCVGVKHTKVKTPKWPTNTYYDPASTEQEYACPICVSRGSPCVWSRGDLVPRVLPLPPHARAPGANPQSKGYYIAQ